MRIGVAVAAALGLTLLGGGVASAQEPITISPEKVRQICEQRVPKIEERVTKLTSRINGGPEVVGSTKWLQARAAEARDAGRTEQAQRLEERAARRSGHLEKLGKALERVEKFKTNHCSYK